MGNGGPILNSRLWPPLPHMLMPSGPSLGKTELSCILANEVGMEGGPHEQLAQNIRTPADLHALLLTPKDKEVCLIDEIHDLHPIAQTALYRAMENQQIFLETKRGKKSRPVKIANFTIIDCTTVFNEQCVLFGKFCNNGVFIFHNAMNTRLRTKAQIAYFGTTS